MAPEYDDTYANLQHGIGTLSLRQAHRHSLGAGIRVAVIDGSADIDHEDLQGGIQAIDIFTAAEAIPHREHGTAVSSVIAARANNSKGIVGVAPGSEIDLYVACWSSPGKESAVCDSFSLAKALDSLLDRPPDILNMSLIGPPDPLLRRLLRKAYERDVIIVAANPGGNQQTSYFPASMEEVINVASYGKERSRTGQLLAPGEEILVAIPENAYDFRSGSSLAAAHVSGVIALLLEIAPKTRATTVQQILESSQQSHAGSARSVDACQALRIANESLDCRDELSLKD